MGSAMSPRPWYVSTPRMRRSSAVAGAVDAVAIHGAHRDGLEALVAEDHELDLLAYPSRPEAPVEFLLGRDLLAIDADDDVALTEAGAPGRPRGRHAGDHDPAPRALLRVETEPWPRRAALHPPLGEQLVFARKEFLDGNGQVHDGGLSEPQRRDADDRPRLIHEGGAPEGGVVRGDEERAVEHVLPGGRERANRLHAALRDHEVAIFVDPYRPREIAGGDLARIAEGRRRPRPGSLELDHPEPGLEVERVELARHLAPVAQRHLDAGGVQHHVADGEDIAGLVEDDAAAPPLDADGRRGGSVGRHLDAKADHGRRHASHIGR